MNAETTVTAVNVRGNAVKELRNKSPRRTETVAAVPVRRHIEGTVGRTHERRLMEERAATQHTAMCAKDHFLAVLVLDRLITVYGGIFTVGFLTPRITV